MRVVAARQCWSPLRRRRLRAHILNAKGEKLQKIIAISGCADGLPTIAMALKKIVLTVSKDCGAAQMPRFLQGRDSQPPSFRKLRQGIRGIRSFAARMAFKQ